MTDPHHTTLSTRSMATGLLGMAAALCLLPESASASFGGRMQLGFGFIFLAAALFALPGALLCLLFELVGARRRVPLWVGIIAAGLALYCAARAIGFGPRGDAVYFLLPVPPLMTLALVTFLRPPWLRLAAVWMVAALGIGLVLGAEKYFGSTLDSAEPWALPLGGAFMSLMLWQLGFFLRQRSRRDAAAPPAPAPEKSNPLGPGIDWWSRANPGRLVWSAGASAPQGLVWWLGGAAAYYVGIGVLTALGFDALSGATLQIEWQLANFLGLRTPAVGAKPLREWAVHGLAWSAVAGCGTWGAAATAGRFDAGPLSPLRFAAVVITIAMLLAVAIVASQAKY